MFRVTLVLFTVGITACVCLGNLQAEEKQTIKSIMKTLHKGSNSTMSGLQKDLKNKSPNWDDVQKKSAQYLELAEALGKNKPKKGKQDSWDKLCESFVKDSKALNDAAKDKDRDAAGKALDALNKSCTECHNAHR